MDCPECERLRTERAARHLVYQSLTRNMDEAGTGNIEEYIRLKTLADQAWISLDVLETHIRQHHEAHAVE
jgi:hypothetical protein